MSSLWSGQQTSRSTIKGESEAGLQVAPTFCFVENFWFVTEHGWEIREIKDDTTDGEVSSFQPEKSEPGHVSSFCLLHDKRLSLTSHFCVCERDSNFFLLHASMSSCNARMKHEMERAKERRGRMKEPG